MERGRDAVGVPSAKGVPREGPRETREGPPAPALAAPAADLVEVAVVVAEDAAEGVLVTVVLPSLATPTGTDL